MVDFLCEDIDLISTVAEIYHLTVDEHVDADALASLLIHLPTLDSISMTTFSLLPRENL